MYHCLNCSIPTLFDDFFQRNNDVHCHNTRQANDLHVPYARLDIRKFCFKVHGANIWNNTPIHIRHSPSLDVFKQRLRLHLFESKSIVHPAVNWTVPMNETITYHLTPYDDIEKAYNTFIHFVIHFSFLCVFCSFFLFSITCFSAKWGHMYYMIKCNLNRKDKYTHTGFSLLRGALPILCLFKKEKMESIRDTLLMTQMTWWLKICVNSGGNSH